MAKMHNNRERRQGGFTGILAFGILFSLLMLLVLPYQQNMFSWNGDYSTSSRDLSVLQFDGKTNNHVSNIKTTVALVTLSLGFSVESATETDRQVFFCTRKNLMDYSALHGYAFFSEQNFSQSEALPLLPHMTQGPAINTGRYQKLRFLIQLLEEYPSIEWFLWVDADAVVTDTNSTVEKKIEFFQNVHREGFAAAKFSKDFKHELAQVPPLSMVIAENWDGINNGVFLIRNNDLGRRILLISYLTYVPPNDLWADQKAMILGIFSKETNSSLRRSILSVPRQNAHWLQSYRGCRGQCSNAHYCIEYWTAEKHSWFLHMPNTAAQVRKKHLHAIGICNFQQLVK